MLEICTKGSLGDAYIQSLKISMFLEDYVTVYHHTKHKYWESIISEILHFAPNVVKVIFTQYPKEELYEITSDSHEQKMNFFPKLKIVGKYKVIKPYYILQPHSGKPFGGNTKHLPYFFITETIKREPLKCVLLGTDERYENLKGCINLIGKTTVTDLIYIIKNAEKFIGPEGLLSFIALSHQIKSDVYFTSHEAVEKRIIGTPWASFANLQNLNKITGD